MKKITAWLLTLIIVLSASVTAFAAETVLDGENRQTDIGVYAEYIDNTDLNTVPVDGSGEGTLLLPDGTEINVGGVTESGWRLVIDPVTDREALGWIESVLDGKLNNISAYHIFYINDSGNIKAAKGVRVTIKLPKKLDDPLAYSLTKEEKASQLTATEKDGKITFTTDAAPFYAIGEKQGDKTGETDKTPSNAETSAEENSSAQTGDNSRLTLWIVLMLISAAGLAACVICGKVRSVGRQRR